MSAVDDGGCGPLVVDARGMRCPWPALRLARAMRDVTAVQLISDDPRAANEVMALAGQRGWAVSFVAEGTTLQANVTRHP